jgi:NAD(P)H-flavin reductase
VADIHTAGIVSRTGAPVQRIVLSMPSGFTFQAGQYLEVLHPRGSVPLSIASAPRRLPALHLHYRSTPGLPEAALLDELLASGADLTVRGPAGNVGLPKPLVGRGLLVAGGTGIAQALAFIDDQQPAADHPGLTLLWCADDEADFYLGEELAVHAAWLDTVLIADADRSPRNRALSWLSRHAQAYAGPDQPIVIAGSPPFVYAATDVLMEAGVPERQIQSDVFSYAPRRNTPPTP